MVRKKEPTPSKVCHSTKNNYRWRDEQNQKKDRKNKLKSFVELDYKINSKNIYLEFKFQGS